VHHVHHLDRLVLEFFQTWIPSEIVSIEADQNYRLDPMARSRQLAILSVNKPMQRKGESPCETPERGTQ